MLGLEFLKSHLPKVFLPHVYYISAGFGEPAIHSLEISIREMIQDKMVFEKTVGPPFQRVKVLQLRHHGYTISSLCSSVVLFKNN